MSIEDFPQSGFVRISQFIGPGKLIPVSESTWWSGVKNGRFPPPVQEKIFGPRITVWRVEDIINFVNQSKDLSAH